MMKKLVSWLFFIGLGLTALLLVLPGFIDWSRHKDLLVSDLSNRLGQDIRIDGDVSLRLLPNPHLNLEKVQIGSAEKNRYLVSLAALDARMSMDKLLKGQFVIDQIHLQEPVINISIDQTGSNWRDFWQKRAAQAQITSGTMIALKQVSVSRASVTYHNHITGQQWSLPRINMALTADSLAGPYQARGDMVYGDAPLTFTLATQPRDANGALPFTLDITPIENMPQAKIAGVFAPLADVPLSFTVDAREGKIINLLTPFDELSQAAGGIAALNANGQATFKVELRDKGLAFENIKVSTASGATLAGSALYNAARSAIDADVTMTQPGMYWLSYDGIFDVVRKQHKAVTGWKIEDASKLAEHAPPVSVEIDGELTADSSGNWLLDNATLSLPDWANTALQGRVQRVQGQTVFALAAAQLGIASDITLNGQLAQSLTADGTATVFGRAIPFTLTGAPAKPDLSISLAGVAPQDVLVALGMASKDASLEGGEASFKGQIDMTAASLAQTLSGTLALSPQKIKIAAFDPAALQKKIITLDKVGDDLPAQLLAALNSAEGRFTAKPLSLTLPAADKAWRMTGLPYDGGTFDFGTDGSAASVSVTANDETKVAYKGKLPLTEKDMPVERAGALINEKHPPAPDVDTKATIGDILDRLEDTPIPTPQEAAEAPPAQQDPIGDIFVVKPPAVDVPQQPEQGEVQQQDMPPQPAPALPEVEIAPPPALPEDTPLAVEVPSMPDDIDGVDIPPTEDVPDEIFPVE